MKLRALEAELLWKLELREDGEAKSYRTDCPTLAEAQGILFLCPKCMAEMPDGVGVHSVICWFEGRGVPPTVHPNPGRWTPSGTLIDDLTFVPGNPPRAVSVLLTGGCGWHGFVRDGDAS